MRPFPALIALVVVALLAVPAAAAAQPARSSVLAPQHTGASSAGPTHTTVLPTGAHARVPLTGPLSRFPHPSPIPAGSSPLYSGHYYAGSVYNSTLVNSTQLSATINIPLDNPQLTDFYYVLLSVWDDAGSYDQVGFANAGGVWGFTYSSTSYCGGNYYYTPDAFNLNAGTTYTFGMTLWRGTVNFTADYLNGTNAFTWTQYTGGHVFLNEAFYTCTSYYYGNVSYYDLTDYEEVYATNNPVVPYDWHFGTNLEDGLPESGWSIFTTPPLPGAISVLISTDNTLIANEPYELGLTSGSPFFTIVSGSSSVGVHASLEATALVGTPTVVFGAYSLPGGWSVSYSPSSGTASLGSTVTITIPALTGGGNYSIGLNASDSSGASNQVTLWVNLISSTTMTVNGLPHPFGDVGQNITFYVSTGGGVNGITISWSGLPSGCSAGNAPQFVCLLTSPGTYPVVATAKDVYGDSASSSALIFIVYPDVVITLNVVPLHSDIGQTVSFFASAFGGAGGTYSYVYHALPAGCKVTGPNATCSVTVAGTYNVSVAVTDASGYSVLSAPAAVEVVPAPSMAVQTSSQAADAGQTVWLNASATGGTGTFAYTWTDLPTACTARAQNATCTFPSAGSYYVSVEAQDSAGVFTTAQRVLLQISPALKVRLATPLPSVDLGAATTFSTTVNGGAPSFHFVYVGLPTGCVTSDTGALSCTASATGVFSNITVSVTDANRNLVRAETNLTVFSAPSVALSVSPAKVVQGAQVTFTATVTGGSGGASFVWTDLPGGCQSSTGPTISCVPSGAGAYSVTVSMTDTDGGRANASAVLTVTAPPAVSSSDLYLVVALVVVAAVAVGVGVAVWRMRRRRGGASAETAQ